jgi:hypothetical protein
MLSGDLSCTYAQVHSELPGSAQANVHAWRFTIYVVNPQKQVGYWHQSTRI